MKRLMVSVVLLLAFAAVPGARAQGAYNHVDLGIFGDYTRITSTDQNFLGLGGRAAFNVGSPYVQLEAEMNYDFEQAFTEEFSEGDTTEFHNSNIQLLHGMFGPKLQTRGPVKFFVTAKGGFINLRFNPRPASFDGFTSDVGDLRTNNVDATFYPAGGIEAFAGPIGLRIEVGDEIVFVHGIHNDLRVTFGPQLRF